MRDANPDCVTVLLTGYPGFETALKAIHTEVDDYVVKPADIAVRVSTMEGKLSARRARRGRYGLGNLATDAGAAEAPPRSRRSPARTEPGAGATFLLQDSGRI